MRIAPAITLSSDQQATLEQWARSRSLPLRVIERARIVLRAAAGRQDKEIATAMKITEKKASRWRNRFLTLGMAGLETRCVSAWPHADHHGQFDCSVQIFPVISSDGC